MKTVTRAIALGVLLSLGLFQGPAFAALIEGKITTMSLSRKTLHIIPAQGGEVTEKTLFVIRPTTVMERWSTLKELYPGDKIKIEANQVNEVVWTAAEITKVY